MGFVEVDRNNGDEKVDADDGADDDEHEKVDHHEQLVVDDRALIAAVDEVVDVIGPSF